MPDDDYWEVKLSDYSLTRNLQVIIEFNPTLPQDKVSITVGGEDKWPRRSVNLMLNELNSGERSLSEYFFVLLLNFV